MKFERGGNGAVEADAVDEGVDRDDVVRETALEKLPEDGEGESDLADVAEAVDEDGEGDVAGGDAPGARLRLGAKENRGGEALRLREGGEDSVEGEGGAWGRARVEKAREGR